MTRTVSTVLVSVLAAGCMTDTTTYDPFPIPVSLDTGAILLGARSTDIDSAGTVRTAVVDTGTPVTVFDVGQAATSRLRASIELIGAGTGVPRAQFDAVAALLGVTGSVGEGTASPIGAIIGGDMLVLHALRINASASSLIIFPNVAADDTTLAESCLGSFGTPLAGGGLFKLGNDSVRFPASRVILSVCLAPPFHCDLTGACAGGTDSILLVSTGVRPIVLSRSVYERLTSTTDADVDALPTTTLFLPGGTRTAGVTVHQATSAGLAIADRGNHGDDNPARGACLEYRASRIMTGGANPDLGPGCTAAMRDAIPRTCPCLNGSLGCAVGPSMETQRSLDVVVVEDTDPLLQSIRDEVRPNFADVSGLIGVQALESLVVDVDYPKGRVVARCADGVDSTCVIRPAVTGGSTGDVQSRSNTLKGLGCFQ